ncbi:hypothetical protein [Streptomyces sp. NPDC002588]|uniref:hypothetical protein n=1 Tax=Streptomyces sp. NPDC002588 TaxID=3154419 RepID=UPI00332806CB
MRALSGVQREWSGAPAVPRPSAPSAGRALRVAGGRIGEVVSREQPEGGLGRSEPGGWVLRVTISAPPSVAHLEKQRKLLNPLTSFDPGTRTWSVMLGAVDPAALLVLRSCLTAARDYRARVQIDPVPAPDRWDGPVLARPSDDGVPMGSELLENVGS